MYSCEPLYRDEQRQDVQLEHTYSSSVMILDVAQKTCQGQWMIGRGGERGSEISVLMIIMQSSLKELSTLAADRVSKCKQTDAAAVAT